jgi:hypothetical protein
VTSSWTGRNLRSHPEKPVELTMASKNLPIPVERIEKAILLIRGEKVILDRTLADLYGVQTKQLKRAVRRNKEYQPVSSGFHV